MNRHMMFERSLMLNYCVSLSLSDGLHLCLFVLLMFKLGRKYIINERGCGLDRGNMEVR